MINWDRVEELRDEIGAEDFAEVVELFLEEVEQVIDKLSRAPDVNTLGDDLHFLKGSAMNLGFQALGKICQSEERKAARGAAAEVEIGPVIETYEMSRTTFLDALARQGIRAS